MEGGGAIRQPISDIQRQVQQQQHLKQPPWGVMLPEVWGEAVAPVLMAALSLPVAPQAAASGEGLGPVAGISAPHQHYALELVRKGVGLVCGSVTVVEVLVVCG